MGAVRHRWGATARARHGTPRCRHSTIETGRAPAGVFVNGPGHQGGGVLSVARMATDRRKHEWGGGFPSVALTTTHASRPRAASPIVHFLPQISRISGTPSSRIPPTAGDQTDALPDSVSDCVPYRYRKSSTRACNLAA